MTEDDEAWSARGVPFRGRSDRFDRNAPRRWRSQQKNNTRGMSTSAWRTEPEEEDPEEARDAPTPEPSPPRRERGPPAS